MSEQSNKEAIRDPAAAARAAGAVAKARELITRIDKQRPAWELEKLERMSREFVARYPNYNEEPRIVAEAQGLIYKTCATDEQRLAHRRAVIARARKLVARLDAQQRDRLVYDRHLESKARAEAILARGQQHGKRESTESEAQMAGTTNTEHPYEVLAGELGACAARIELDAIRKVEALKAELALVIERRLTEQAKEIAELRGMISVLLTRTAQPDQPIVDFNQARAAARN